MTRARPRPGQSRAARGSRRVTRNTRDATRRDVIAEKSRPARTRARIVKEREKKRGYGEAERGRIGKMRAERKRASAFIVNL